jgi:CRP-like cAMP-binding protein
MFHDPGQILELKQFPMFENYKEEELEKLLYRCYHFTYNPGDAIKHKGYHTDFFIFLTEGTIETITTVKNGQKVLREQFHSPKLVAPTIPFASDDTATTIYITALTKVKIWEFHRDTLLYYVCSHHPKTLRLFLQEMSNRSQFIAELLLTPLDKILIDRDSLTDQEIPNNG